MVALGADGACQRAHEVFAGGKARHHGREVVARPPAQLRARPRVHVDAIDGRKQVPPARSVNRLVLRHEARSEEHTSELQSLMRISYAVFCLKKKKNKNTKPKHNTK